MTTILANLAASAHEIMAQYPAKHGWQRLASRPCGGRHERTPGAGPMIYHRRRRDYFTDDYHDLDVEADPPLTAVEQIPTALCVSRFFYDANMLCNSTPVIAASMGILWTFDGDYAPGMLVHLNAANGHWVWECTDDQSCCGGYLARWRD